MSVDPSIVQASGVCRAQPWTQWTARPIFVAVALLITVLASASSAQAQGPSFPDRVRFGGGRDATRAVAVGDLNQDGHLDLAVGLMGQANTVYLNDGMGALKAHGTFGTGSDRTQALALADMDGDGDLDIVAGNDGQNAVYLNDGTAGVWQEFPFGTGDDKTLAVAVGDVDGTNGFDIVVANDGQDAIYLNQGNGVPAAAGRSFGPASGESTSVALADIDRANGLDIIVIDGDSRIVVYLNDGQGSFAEGDLGAQVMQTSGSIRNPLERLKEKIEALLGKTAVAAEEETIRSLALGAGSGGAVAAGDMDGVNGPDLVVGNSKGQDVVFLNDGAGRFSAPPAFFGSDDADTQAVALGDLDGDGDLDVVEGNLFDPNRVFLNDGRGGLSDGMPFGTGTDLTTSTALGDLDGDGDLDIVAVNSRQQDAVYLNNGLGTLQPSLSFGDQGPMDLRDAILADVTGDGLLDVLVAQRNGPNLIYPQLEDGRFAPAAAGFVGSGDDLTTSLAAGDLDGDGKLDVVVGNSTQPSMVYLNGGQDALSGYPLDETSYETQAVAIGDVDGDGDLDVVVGNASQGNAVYLNDGTGSFPEMLAFGQASLSTRSVALGDVDGDGDLDIATGNTKPFEGQQDVIYLNDGNGRFDWEGATRLFGNGADNTRSVVLGDVNGDGFLDVVAAHHGLDGGQDAVYLNNGRGEFDWSGSERHLGDPSEPTAFLTVGDADGDGDLDVLTDTALHLNDGTGTFDQVRSFEPAAGDVRPVALGDMDRDGSLDLVLLDRNGRHAVYLNHLQHAPGLVNAPFRVVVTSPDPTPAGGFSSSARVLTDTVISLAYGLSDQPDGRPGALRACYSLDGGGSWQVAVEGDDAPGEVVRPPSGCPYVADDRPGSLSDGSDVFRWNTFASGLFGQSDNVVFRIEAYPEQRPMAGGLPPASQRPYMSAQTDPFRVRGTQVRVYSGTITTTNVISNALVYRLPAGQVAGAEAIGAGDVPYRTDSQGYLQGRGEIAIGDRLVALLPVDPSTPTQPFTLYYTSATPELGGLQAHEVEEEGVQELVVSQDNPLLLFDLDVSLEWDARNDGGFLESLEQAIQKSSEILYDVTNGQMALGEVRIHQNGEGWEDADMLIYASNSIRPRATMGGISQEYLDEQLDSDRVIANAYGPGKIRMGPNWDPFGETREDLSQEWWRALAHEYGHYMLFLPDNYLGYDPAGFIRSVDCAGSFMTTAYDDQYSEFLDLEGLPPDQWPGECAQTFAARTTGRSDWETITQFYDMVRSPSAVLGRTSSVSETVAIDGPVALPLQVTQVRYDSDDGDALSARNFDLRRAGPAAQRLIVPQGQAYLFKTQGTRAIEDDTVVALGVTGNRDFIKVRGAEPADPLDPDRIGDRICVYDLGGKPSRLGCIDSLEPLSSTIALSEVRDWKPNVLVKPIIQPTTLITVTWPISPGQPSFTSRTIYGPTPAITPTLPSGEGQSYVLTVAEPRQVITITAPISRELPYQVILAQPALAITATLPVDPGDLHVQVYPGQRVAEEAPTANSPWARMTSGDGQDGDEVSYATTVLLDRPLFSGFARVWVPNTGKEAISQFLLPAEWTVNLRSVEANLRPGDANLRPGDANLRPGDANLRPGDANLRPGDVNLRLGEANLRPGDVNFRVAGANLRPGDANLRPGDANLRPGDANLRPGDANLRPGDANLRPGDANLRPGDANLRPGDVNRRALQAPVESDDGQVTVFNADDVLADTGTELLQALPVVPGLPEWLTRVGQGYRFAARDDTKRNIAFTYLARDVPKGYEHTLRIYHSPDEGMSWRALDTWLDTEENLAVAPVESPGLYTLVASVDIPLAGAGWQLFAYPIPETRPLVDALQSISGTYNALYGYVGTELSIQVTGEDAQEEQRLRQLCGEGRGTDDDPWLVYDSAAPDWANDLRCLEFGLGYWINITATEPITVQLGVPITPTRRSPLTLAGGQDIAETVGRQTPPAAVYGTIAAEPDIDLTMPMTVTAWVDGQNPCGESLAFAGDAAEPLRYRVKVRAASPEEPGCGAPGRTVALSLTVDSQVLPLAVVDPTGSAAGGPVVWDNGRLTRADVKADVVTEPLRPVTPPEPPKPPEPPEPPSLCQMLPIRNGGFEQEGGWRLLGAPSEVAFSTDDAYAGRRALLLGSLPGANLTTTQQDVRASARQWVDVPDGPGTVSLAFRYKPGNQGEAGGVQRVGLLLPVYTDLLRVLENEDEWQLAELDLTAYKGKTVGLIFEVLQNAGTVEDGTWMWVDEVSLEVCH